MKKTVKVYLEFDDDDVVPWNIQIEEAFNRCWNFAEELWYDHKVEKCETDVRKVFNRITNSSKAQFELPDVWTLATYAGTVFERALAASHEPQNGPLRESLRQAADNLANVMATFKREAERMWNNS
jgi:type 1 glutamine amidotransferase